MIKRYSIDNIKETIGYRIDEISKNLLIIDEAKRNIQTYIKHLQNFIDNFEKGDVLEIKKVSENENL